MSSENSIVFFRCRTYQKMCAKNNHYYLSWLLTKNDEAPNTRKISIFSLQLHCLLVNCVCCWIHIFTWTHSLSRSLSLISAVSTNAEDDRQRSILPCTTLRMQYKHKRTITSNTRCSAVCARHNRNCVDLFRFSFFFVAGTKGDDDQSLSSSTRVYWVIPVLC